MTKLLKKKKQNLLNSTEAACPKVRILKQKNVYLKHREIDPSKL